VEFRPPVSGDADPAPAVGERSRQRSSFLNRVEQTLLTSGFGRADLATVLQEAAIELGPLADARHITLKLQNAVADTEIEASHDLLREVMLHLGRNAIEFTPPSGTVCLKLSADARDLMLEVDDTGIGIDPARLKDLFDPFRRTQAPDGNQGELAGVRLAMCRRIVGWHGGRLFIESSGTRGTRAYVILPREAARREPRGAGKQSEVLPIGGTASS
jgi:signal transduction histidine kinase